MQHRHRPQALPPLRPPTVHQDRPATRTATGPVPLRVSRPPRVRRHPRDTRRLRISEHLPGCQHPDLRLDLDLARRQAQSLLGSAGEVVLVPPGWSDRQVAEVHPLKHPADPTRLQVPVQHLAQPGVPLTPVEPESVTTRLPGLEVQQQGHAVSLNPQDLDVLRLRQIRSQQPARDIGGRADRPGRGEHHRGDACRGGRNQTIWGNLAN